MYEWWMTENLDTFTQRAFEMEYSFPLSLWMRQQDKTKHISFLKTIGYDSKEKVCDNIQINFFLRALG
jgi:hypothetical protein